MQWRRILYAASVAVTCLCANAESEVGVVSGESPDALVHFDNKTDSYYSIYARPANNDWKFTEDFSWRGPNGWYSDKKYFVICEKLKQVETAFVDASLCFGVSMNGSMYKSGGEGGSPIPWSVSTDFHSAPQPYIYPAESIWPQGQTETLRYVVDNVMTNAPGGLWKYYGTTAAGDSVQINWQNVGASYTLPATLDAGLYSVYAARNSKGAFQAAATVTLVGVKELSATSGSTTVTSTTDSPEDDQTLYVAKDSDNVTITATPEPGSAWPENYPTWQLNGLSSGTVGSTTYSLGTETAGEYIVSATCGTSTKAIKVVVWEIISETEVTSPADRTRKTVGVGEIVNLSTNPSISITWSITGGGNISAVEGTRIKFTAGGRQSTSVIKGIKSSSNKSIVFSVLEPTGVTMEQIVSAGIEHINGKPTLAALLRIYVKPTNVSFTHIAVGEGTCPATECLGYFSELQIPPHPAGDYFVMNKHVPGKGTLLAGSDTVSFGLDINYPEAGGYTWAIPYYFIVHGSTLDAKQFTIVKQVIYKTANGDVTISKGGAEVSCGLNEPTSSFSVNYDLEN